MWSGAWIRVWKDFCESIYQYTILRKDLSTQFEFSVKLKIFMSGY